MKKIIISLCLVLALLCSLFMLPADVNAEQNSLAPYYAVLEEMNEELKTDYMFPSAVQMEEAGESYSELVEFYTSMSMDEFRSYVRAAYDNEAKEDKCYSDIVIDSEIEPLAYNKKQKYYYDASSLNYLFISSTVYSADGVERYSSVDSYGHTEILYPYYTPSSMSKSFGTGYKTVTCTFSCVKYIAKNLISATAYTLKVTFSASGGNVSAGSVV